MAGGEDNMERWYLLTTEHLEEGLWFRDNEDFKVGMNHVAIEASRHDDVIVLAFILMSNHVHFVLGGEKEEVTLFVEDFKSRYSQYLNKKYGVKEFLRRNDIDVQDLYEDEALERAIAYVQMNCVAANICIHPSQYQWGTGNVFFNATTRHGKLLAQYSGRARKRLMHSEDDSCPLGWRIGEEGYVLPEDYVHVSAVENIYRKPGRMNYFLNSSSKAKRRIENAEDKLPSFRDQIILAALPDLCRSLFKKDSYKELSSLEQAEFMRQIRFRFSADINQVARVCGLTYSEAARKIDCV